MIYFIDGVEQRQWLKAMREPLSLQEAAPLIGVHFNTLLVWEQGERPLTLEEIATVRAVNRCLKARRR